MVDAPQVFADFVNRLGITTATLSACGEWRWSAQSVFANSVLRLELFDEPVIEEVLCFHISEILSKGGTP